MTCKWSPQALLPEVKNPENYTFVQDFRRYSLLIVVQGSQSPQKCHELYNSLTGSKAVINRTKGRQAVR